MRRRQQATAVRQGQAFKGRQFSAEVILWAVRWHLMVPISYRDLELMLQERGVAVDHTPLFRWIQACRRTGETPLPAAAIWRCDSDFIGSPLT
jgi:IS6 family transposase